MRKDYYIIWNTNLPNAQEIFDDCQAEHLLNYPTTNFSYRDRLDGVQRQCKVATVDGWIDTMTWLPDPTGVYTRNNDTHLDHVNMAALLHGPLWTDPDEEEF